MDPTLRTAIADESVADGSAESLIKRENPWKRYAGIWRENPDFDALLKAIEDRRREADEASEQ